MPNKTEIPSRVINFKPEVPVYITPQSKREKELSTETERVVAHEQNQNS